MLVLTRKVQEEIVAGDITIKIIRVKGRSVRIGIEAPSNVRVRRAELDPLSDTRPREEAMVAE